jgi:hypothetical protein
MLQPLAQPEYRLAAVHAASQFLAANRVAAAELLFEFAPELEDVAAEFERGVDGQARELGEPRRKPGVGVGEEAATDASAGGGSGTGRHLGVRVSGRVVG